MKKIFFLLIICASLAKTSSASIYTLEAYNPDSTVVQIPMHWNWFKSVAKPSRASLVANYIQDSYNQLVAMVGIVKIEESWVMDTEHGPTILFKYYSDNHTTENIVAIYLNHPSYNYHQRSGVV